MVVKAQSKPGTQTTQVEIVHADLFSSKKIGNRELRRLVGNVSLKHDEVLMDCDSAYFFEEKNSVTAFGNIHIRQGDSLNMYGKLLEYDGNRKYAVIKQDVSLTDREMTLTTDRLDYDMKSKMAFYVNGGTITDAENTLTSKRGYYYSGSRDLYFRKEVVLTNPQYKMTCDTLQYNIASRKAFFHGPTRITSASDLIYCESGWYDTEQNKAQFGKNAYLRSGSQYLYGDSLYYDRNRAYGQARRNIRVLDTLERLQIEGQLAEHFEKERRTFITRDVLVTKGFNKDSIYLSADTVHSAYDATGKYRILRGYHHVKVFNREFQALSDSIHYSFVDSTMEMTVQPVLWFGKYQCSAERIVVFTKNNQVIRAEMYQKSFMLSPEDSLRFNQIKGRDMTGYFADNNLYHIDVTGNGEGIYFLRDDAKKYIGMNYIIGSDIRIGINNNQVRKINFVKEPNGSVRPIKELSENDMRLTGFNNREPERPKNLEALRAPRPVAPPKTKPAPAPKKKKTTPKKKAAVKKK